MKDKKITEDDEKRSLDEIQKLTDDEIKKMEEMSKAKEKEVLEIKYDRLRHCYFAVSRCMSIPKLMYMSSNRVLQREPLKLFNPVT